MRTTAYPVKGPKPHFSLVVGQSDEADVYICSNPSYATLSVEGWGARERIIEIIKALQEAVEEAS